jgi:LysM domain
VNASKTNLVTVLTITAALMMTSVSFARTPNSNNGGIPPRPKKNNFSSSTLSKTAIGVANGETFIGTNLNNVNSLSGDKGKGKGITITHGGNPPHSPESYKWKNKFWYCDHSHHIVFCDHFVEPVLAQYIVLPGDTLEVISLKLFNTPRHSLFLASLNRLPVNSVLIPGQVILVPTF